MLKSFFRSSVKRTYPRAPKALEIMKKCRVVYPNYIAGRLAEYFEAAEPETCMIVEAKGKVAGIVLRDKYRKLMNFYVGKDVFFDRRVELIMDPKPLVVSTDTRIDKIFEMIWQRPETEQTDHIVVVENGLFKGVIDPANLIDRYNDFKIRVVELSNKMTKLPGSELIKEELDILVAEKRGFSALHIDVNGMKEFNDNFGYDRGDEVLASLAQMVEKTASARILKGGYAYAGHFGGDDLFLLTDPEEASKACFDIIEEFDSLSLSNSAVNSSAGICLSIGALVVDSGSSLDVPGIMNSLAQLLSSAKKHFESVYALSDGRTISVNSVFRR